MKKGYEMTKIQKLEWWTVYKHFEAETAEEALEMGKNDSSDDWQYLEDDDFSYYLGDENA